jgi:hypothetical protein
LLGKERARTKRIGQLHICGGKRTGQRFGLERLVHIFLILRPLGAAYQKKALPLAMIVAKGDPDFAGMISSANQPPKLSP